MIAKSAIDDFVNRKLCDSRKAKRFTTEALDAKLAQLDPPPVFHSPLRHLQKVCFLLSLKYPQYLHFLDMGLGKTYLTLSLIDYFKKIEKVQRGLILVPNTTNIETWKREAKKRTPHLSVLGVVGDREQREEVLDSDADVVICTYMGWLSLTCDRKRHKMVPSSRLKTIASTFQLVAYDEPHTMLSSHKSLSFRVCERFIRTTPFRYALDGTPFGVDPQELWPMFYLVDGGETLGETLGLFRSVFCTEKDNYWSGYPEYEFDKRKKRLLNRMIRHRSIRYSEEECNDLPKYIPIKRPVVWPAESWAYYEKMLARIRDAKKAKGLTENLFLRMRQICSGFLTATGAEGEKIEIQFEENPKLDALIEAVQEVRPDRKIIIFHEFIRSGEVISERLKKLKIKHVRVFSGTKHSERQNLEERFENDPTLRVIVGSQAIAHGLNLQAANYEFWFETPTSPKIRKQEEKRAHRQGQTRKVFGVDFFIKNSIEAKILQYIKDGRDLFDEIVEGKKVGLL